MGYLNIKTLSIAYWVS